MREYRDAAKRLNIELSRRNSRFLFLKYAFMLKIKFKAKLQKKIGNPYERWWDFSIDDTIVVLHSESMAGISIHLRNVSNDELLREIGRNLLGKELM